MWKSDTKKTKPMRKYLSSRMPCAQHIYSMHWNSNICSYFQICSVDLRVRYIFAKGLYGLIASLPLRVLYEPISSRASHGGSSDPLNVCCGANCARLTPPSDLTAVLTRVCTSKQWMNRNSNRQKRTHDQNNQSNKTSRMFITVERFGQYFKKCWRSRARCHAITRRHNASCDILNSLTPCRIPWKYTNKLCICSDQELENSPS